MALLQYYCVLLFDHVVILDTYFMQILMQLSVVSAAAVWLQGPEIVPVGVLQLLPITYVPCSIFFTHMTFKPPGEAGEGVVQLP